MKQSRNLALAYLERQAKQAPSQEARERFEKMAAEMREKMGMKR